jgi:hypothetical protein
MTTAWGRSAISTVAKPAAVEAALQDTFRTSASVHLQKLTTTPTLVRSNATSGRRFCMALEREKTEIPRQTKNRDSDLHRRTHCNAIAICR